jgi:hypothetical protein
VERTIKQAKSEHEVGVRRSTVAIGSEREQKDHTSCNSNPLVDGRLTVRLMRQVDWTC